MKSIIDPGLDTKGLISAGPLQIPTRLRTITITLSYAEIAAMANLANPRELVGGIASSVIIPISATEVTTRLTPFAGTTCAMVLRWGSWPVNLMSITANFANGGAVAGIQYQMQNATWAAQLVTLGLEMKGNPLFLLNSTAAVAGASAGASWTMTLAYLVLPM